MKGRKSYSLKKDLQPFLTGTLIKHFHTYIEVFFICITDESVSYHT